MFYYTEKFGFNSFFFIFNAEDYICLLFFAFNNFINYFPFGDIWKRNRCVKHISFIEHKPNSDTLCSVCSQFVLILCNSIGTPLDPKYIDIGKEVLIFIPSLIKLYL